MLEPGTYTATLDRFEDAPGTELAVLLVERDGADASQLDLPAEVVPSEGRRVDAVFDLTVAADRFELAFHDDETTQRAEAAQSRFDRLAQRPPSSEQ